MKQTKKIIKDLLKITEPSIILFDCAWNEFVLN